MRLIDADRLKGYLYENYVMYDHTLADIDAQPTVDAVEVVRCKDCKWWNVEYCDTLKVGACTAVGRLVYPRRDDYCSRGERKEDETD